MDIEEISQKQDRLAMSSMIGMSFVNDNVTLTTNTRDVYILCYLPYYSML